MGGIASVRARKSVATPGETDRPRPDALPSAAAEADRGQTRPVPSLLGSGLSWMAWAKPAPGMLPGGFTDSTNEFASPYQSINWHACRSCWYGARLCFDFGDCPWRPRDVGAPRRFQCRWVIAAEQVIATLKCLPGLIERARSGKPATTPAAGESGGIAA